MKKISVIVPVYNVEEYLDDCLNSLVNQNFEDYEIIVVNDGSPDNSQRIIDKYVKKCPKIIKSYIKENGGLSSARNYGLEQSNSKYIAFVDSDDYVDFNYLKLLYEKANSDDYDIVVCDMYKMENDNLEILSGKCNKTKNNLNDFIISLPNAWNKLYKRNLFIQNEIYYPDKIYYEDLATTPRLLVNTKKISYVDKPLYYYRIRTGSITNQVKYNHKTADMFTSLNIVSEYFKETGFYDKYYDEIEYLYIVHLLHNYSISIYRFKEGKENILKVANLIRNEFPNWKKNKYLKSDSLKYKIVCNLFYYKQIWLLKILLK